MRETYAEAMGKSADKRPAAWKCRRRLMRAVGIAAPRRRALALTRLDEWQSAMRRGCWYWLRARQLARDATRAVCLINARRLAL